MTLSWKKIALGLAFCVFLAPVQTPAQNAVPEPNDSPARRKHLAQLQSRGTEASLTILPVRLAGKPFDRVTEVVGLLLEQRGLKTIELGKVAFDPGTESNLERVAAALGESVRKTPLETEYALFAEFNGNPQTGLDELRAIVVDRTGTTIWTERLTAQDDVFRRAQPRAPLQCCVLLVEQLSSRIGLNEQTAKAARPGKMAALMDERSGLPPENERSLLAKRQEQLKALGKKATLAVLPVRLGGSVVDAKGAADVALAINRAGLCQAVAVEQPVVLKASLADPNELKSLWDLAREFRDHAKQNPADADYVLYTDYVFDPDNWEQGFVHFVVCDRAGEWVIVDMQNSHHPGYQQVKPTSREDCDELLVKQLEGFLR